MNKIAKSEEDVISGKGYKYLSEFMNDLPDNVMLNKVTTGCGMTSVVLENDVKYVLVVPFISLIKNKVLWCKENNVDVLAVHSKGSEAGDIITFQGNKILTTYDTLGKVTEALKKKGDLNEWKVCIDESHKLVDSAAFRTKAVRTVLDNYPKYKSFVFGTATPIKDKYQLPKLKNIKKARIDWGILPDVQVNFCQYNSKINDVVAVIAIDFLNGTRTGNAHIFINSVKSICSIISNIHKGGYNQPINIRIVCADNIRNLDLIKKISKSHKISDINSDVRKVNFYTSTAFEGSDIFDKDGKNFIVTDGTKDYTKIDIVTLLPQIIGRLRDSKHKNVVDLLYTKSNYFSHVSEDQFENQVKLNIKEAEQYINDFDRLPLKSPLRPSITDYKVDDSYITVDGDRLLLNDSAMYNEMHNFVTIKQTYSLSKGGITDGIKTFNGIDYIYKRAKKIEIKGLNKCLLGKAASFKDLCIEYIENMKNNQSHYLYNVDDTLLFIGYVYRTLGEDKMRALKYSKKAFSDELLVNSNTLTTPTKIVTLLKLEDGDWISFADAKIKLQHIYDVLNLGTTAKATDLNDWYSLNKKRITVDGKRVDGYVVITCKVNKVPKQY